MSHSEQVEELISLHPDVVCFGSEADQVSQDWIDKAEDTLGVELPVSYKWFLRTYAGGEIGTEEIYSIYGVDFEDVNGGDIVFQHIVGKKNNLVDSKKLVISQTDFGEIFFFDYSKFDDGECPVKLRLPSGESVHYALNFYEFLYKRILSHI
ncbi:SMI1/KNR4 family protein [Bordetella sp. LUAb4]|uniref:SMI1/KNR4 family protein n=1 Tax=Bordetella sp. LUAb4 TaxID=2843195 RepID=UPI001E3858C0|nr:SMI1/KNR4 family protein [Bordetella sp. LUAb4]